MSSSVVTKVVNQLRDFGETRRGWLGVRIQNLNSEVAEALGMSDVEGALVTDVPDGPAKEAGMKSGDVIIRFDGKIVKDSSSLVKVVGDSEVGKRVEVLIWRDGSEEVLFVTLGRLETVQLEASQGNRDKQKVLYISGMSLSSLDSELRDRYEISEEVNGVVVVEVKEESSAQVRGIEVGDVIQKVGQVDVKSPSDVVKILDELKSKNKSSALFLVKRGSNGRFIAIPLVE